MELALFDIDGTLCSLPSSERAFAKYLQKHGELSLYQYWCYLAFISRYFYRYKSSIFKINKAYLAGTNREKIAILADDFVNHEVLPNLYKPVQHRLEYHLHAGDQVVLLSGTLDIIAIPLARYLGVSLVEPTLCSFAGELFSAAPPLQHPFGYQKLVCAKTLAAKTNLLVSNATAYGNSIYDRYLLEAAGNAIAVKPDKKLKLLAEKNGWEILAS